MNEKSKIILKNLITDVIPLIVYSILCLFKSKVLLNTLGSNVLGLYQLFVQLMKYLSLVEGGLGSAVIFSLYTPLLSGDIKKIANLKKGVKKIFKYIIIIIITASLLLTFLIPYLIKDNTFSINYIQVNFTIYVISEVILYLTIFERSLFIADEKSYKINIVTKNMLILKAILEIIMAQNGSNLTEILLMFVIISLLTNLIITIYSKKYYKLDKGDYCDISVLKDVKALFVHKVGSLIASNIDVVILSKIMGLSSVVIYTTYNAIFDTCATIIGKINIASIATIGKLIKKDKKIVYNIFVDFNSMCFYIATIISIPLYFSINYFISIFYDGKIYTNIMISLMFTFLFIYQIIRLPITTYVTAAGYFEETKYCPIIESIINLILSIILSIYWGIAGILFATIISLLISEYFYKTKIIYKKIFDEKTIKYYKTNIIYTIIIALGLIIIYSIQKYIIINNLIQWFLYSALIFILNLIIISFIYYISGNLKFIKRIIKK